MVDGDANVANENVAKVNPTHVNVAHVNVAHVVVSIGGDPSPQAMPDPLNPDYVIAADSGFDLALTLGLAVDELIGDLDSISVDGLAAAMAGSTVIDQHPTLKDQTDFELALIRANQWLDQYLNEWDRPTARRRITVLGGVGGRLDHVVGNVSTLCSLRWKANEITAWIGTSRVEVVRTHATLAGVAGGIVSLIPINGPVEGLTTTGLAWPLANHRLEAGESLGLSNRFENNHASVSMTSGCLLVVTPDAEQTESVLIHNPQGILT